MKKLILLSLLTAVTGSMGALANDKPCAFGDDLSALESNKRFKFDKKIKFDTFKLDRTAENPSDVLVWYTVTQFKDSKTEKVYQVNATYNDSYDGGNTIGWIEDVTLAEDGLDTDTKPSRLQGAGQVVATISDSEISCLVSVK